MDTVSRIGTAKNLAVGGSYDLLLVKFEGTYPEGKMSFEIYDTPMKITGVQKVAQTFMKILLTSKGSDPFYPQRGTFFSEMTVGANKHESDSVFLQEIRASVLDASNQVKAGLNAQNPDTSSCLADVSVLGLDRNGDTVTLYVSITTMDGVSASVAMPFPEFGLG